MEEPTIATVSTKGQFTIPSEMRRGYDIASGTKLLVVPLEAGIVVRPIDLPTLRAVHAQVIDSDDGRHISVSDLDRMIRDWNGGPSNVHR